MAANQEAVAAVRQALLEDHELLIDLWTVVEKAVAKAEVQGFTDEDRYELFATLSQYFNSHIMEYHCFYRPLG